GASGFSIGMKGYIVGGFGDVPKLWEWDQGTNTWMQKATFPGGIKQSAVAFSIGSKGYFGTGCDSIAKKDFWEWDQSTNTWTQKADFGGGERIGAAGFAVGINGYMGFGLDLSGNYHKDFWKWDQPTNTWIQLTDFVGTANGGAKGFSIGSNGYIGLGGYYNDFWEYNLSTGINEIKNNIALDVFPNPISNAVTIS